MTKFEITSPITRPNPNLTTPVGFAGNVERLQAAGTAPLVKDIARKVAAAYAGVEGVDQTALESHITTRLNAFAKTAAYLKAADYYNPKPDQTKLDAIHSQQLSLVAEAAAITHTGKRLAAPRLKAGSVALLDQVKGLHIFRPGGVDFDKTKASLGTLDKVQNVPSEQLTLFKGALDDLCAGRTALIIDGALPKGKSAGTGPASLSWVGVPFVRYPSTLSAYGQVIPQSFADSSDMGPLFHEMLHASDFAAEGGGSTDTTVAEIIKDEYTSYYHQYKMDFSGCAPAVFSVNLSQGIYASMYGRPAVKAHFAANPEAERKFMALTRALTAGEDIPPARVLEKLNSY